MASNSDEKIGRTVFIGGISREVQSEDIEKGFKSFGTIENIKMKGDFAFVEYKRVDDCERAIKEMAYAKIMGHKITVQKSYGGRNRRERGPEGKDVCYNCGNKGHW